MNKNQLLDLFSAIKRNNDANKVTGVNDVVVIVDFLNLFIRSFAGSPAMNSNGEHVGGITAFLISLCLVLKKLNATRCIIVSDGKGSSAKKQKIYPEYKKNRNFKLNLNRQYEFKNSDEEHESMKWQMSRLLEYFEYLPVLFFAIDGVEADETIAYISTELLKDSKIYIVSSDKDYYQLVNDNVMVYSPTKKMMFDKDTIHTKYGIRTKNYVFYRMLDGDKSDNIPGIKGVGLKKIQKHFDFLNEDVEYTVDTFIEKIKTLDNYSKYKIYEDVVSNKNILEMNYELMCLKNVQINANSTAKIRKLIETKVGNLNVFKLLLMLGEDNMIGTIDNFSGLIESAFNRMNFIAQKQLGVVNE